MPFEGHSGISFGHSYAVIYYLYQIFSSVPYDKFHLTSLRIYGIFQQFFDHGSRSLHHFSRRNLVGNIVWQKLNNI